MRRARFPFFRVLAHLCLGLVQALAWLLLWLGLSAALLLLFERAGAQRYAPGDTPHHAFQVLVLQNGAPALVFWHAHQPGGALAMQAPLSGQQGNHAFSFTQTAPGVYELHANRGTFVSTQRYRIEGQGAGARITPLAFRWRNIAHGLIAFIAAVPLLWLLQKGGLRFVRIIKKR